MSDGDLGTRAASASGDAPEPWPWWVWALTFGSYVVLGYWFRSVFLNWIVGPLYPLVVMYLVPAAVRRVLGRPAPAHLRPLGEAPSSGGAP